MQSNSKLEYHDLANLFPMMSSKEFDALKDDIATNGLREPIWLFQNKIIDGRNRYNACLETNTPPIFREYEGDENNLLSFVLSLNLQRRHLSTSQKACLALDILPKLEEDAKLNLSKKISAIRTQNNEVLSKMTKPANSRDEAAKHFGVSGGYISLAKKIKEASIDLFNKVKSGNLTLKQAEQNIKKRKEDLSLLTNPNINTNTNIIESSEVLSIMTNPDDSKPKILTKNDYKKIEELVAFGMKEEKAKEYITNQKRKTKQKTTKSTTQEFAEVKYRLDKSDKEKLKLYAQQHGKSMSEVFRELVKTIKLE